MNKPLLDDIEKIRAVDKSGMIDFCINAPQHYREAAKIAQKIKASYSVPDNIIIVGMGGSAIGGDLFKDWARNKLTVPIEVNREYNLPQYADQKTLVVVSSYSGDTEESLSAFLDALKRGCMVFCVSSGGKLIKAAKKHKVPYLQVPGGMPPRAALPYMLIPLLVYMEKAGLVKGVSEELEETFAVLEKVVEENGPERPQNDNFAKNTAHFLWNSAPVVYGFGFYRSVAQRFKQQFNENSKSPAKWEYFPELDHNEIVGWSGKGEQCKWFSIIFIRDADEPGEIESRIDITKAIIESAGIVTFDLHVQGKSCLSKMLSTVVVGDFLSVYLAVERKADPTPVRTIDLLKNKLKENGVRDEVIRQLEKV
ncbi:MAG: bifunctional phosphoglucose/phosphomannose isomerase [Candidatus Bathyarchaeota archaeon]|nr:bifunctional phosphoglucose/phosphomannose isomerase [Candidatus Bathyarchaeota archaeon]